MEDALSAEDEALLADFESRHGGRYPTPTHTVPGLPEDTNLLNLSGETAKRLPAPSDNSADPQLVQFREKPRE